MQKHLVLAAIGLAAVLAPSATATADSTLTCRGSTSLLKPKDMAYSFGCNQTITSFTIVSTEPLD